MNELSKKNQVNKNRVNKKFNYRKPQAIRVIHKDNEPNMKVFTKNTMLNKQGAYSSIKSIIHTSKKKNTKSSYQYNSSKAHKKSVKIENKNIKNKNLIEKKNIIPPPEKGIIRIIPLGGV